MKRKVSSSILAILLALSLSVPAFAADRGCPSQELLRQILLSRGCGQSLNLNELITQLLGERVSLPEPEQPAEEPQQPVEPEQPAEQPRQPAEEGVPASVRAYEREVVRLVNAERAKYGLTALREDESLSDLARLKSQDMKDRGYFDHNSPTYGTPFQMMKSFGVTYRTAGENIAMGYATPAAVVSAWMNSSGHRANILGSGYTTIGVGYVPQGNYWTQHFIG